MTQQKHILHVFPTLAVGGSQIRFAQLVRLHADRYRHTVISLSGDYAMAARLPADRVALSSVRYDKRDLIGSLKAFHGFLKAATPDVLMTYNWGAIEWAVVNRLAGQIRHLHVEDGFGPEEASTASPKAWARRFALAGQHTSVILPSRTLERIAREIWKLPQQRLNYVPNGIDHVRFAGRPERSSGTVTIGTVATLRREKNLLRLIEAFEKVRADNPATNIRLVIVGDGPERAGLETFTAARGLSEYILFTGASACPEDWLRQMDIFALSSDTEQMPLGVLEAMAAGLAIASTAVGDVAKMVASVNVPFVAPPGPLFEQALETLVKNTELRHQIGLENAKRAAALFDEKVMAVRYAELIG